MYNKRCKNLIVTSKIISYLWILFLFYSNLMDLNLMFQIESHRLDLQNQSFLFELYDVYNDEKRIHLELVFFAENL